MKIIPKLALAVAFAYLLQACGSKKEDLAAPPLSDYFPLTVGKYITYQYDSTGLEQFGTDTTKVPFRYRVKDVVDKEITDALGRKAFRIYRYISNAAGTTPYKENNTFMAVPQESDWIEKNENNLRFMKLRNPIIEGFEWPGNSFIDTRSISSPVRFLDGWSYVYQNVGQPFTVLGRTFENTITVLQRDEEFPEGGFSKDQPFKQWDYSIEVYAKGVGLIYKNFDHKIWDGPPSFNPGKWNDESFRIVLQVVDFN